MGQPVVHFEVIGKDGPKLQRYYSDLFGWEINSDNPMKYGMVDGKDNPAPDGMSIGGGIAAAFAAYKARRSGARVLLVDRSYFGRSGCSALASGIYPSYMPGDNSACVQFPFTTNWLLIIRKLFRSPSACEKSGKQP